MAGRPGRSTPQSASPARKGKPAQGRKAAQPTVLGRVFARPGVIVAGASFAAVMTGILFNALLLQKGHHPSPLFTPAPAEVTDMAPSSPAVPVPPPAPRQATVEPPAAPVEAAPVMEDAPPPVAAAPKPAAHAARKAVAHPATAHVEAKPHKAIPLAHPDLIGQLLGKEDGKH